jgi:hypothetical protein
MRTQTGVTASPLANEISTFLAGRSPSSLAAAVREALILHGHVHSGASNPDCVDCDGRGDLLVNGSRFACPCTLPWCPECGPCEDGSNCRTVTRMAAILGLLPEDESTEVV